MIDIHITNESAKINIEKESPLDVLEKLVETTVNVVAACNVPLNTFAKVLLQYDTYLKNKNKEA